MIVKRYKKVGRPKVGPRIPITFLVSEDFAVRIQRLRKHMRASSNAEIMRRAVDLLDTAVEAHRKGSAVCLRDEKGNTQLIIL